MRQIEDYPITNLKSDKCVYISAKHRTNIDKLIEAIADTAPGKKQKLRLVYRTVQVRL